LHACSKANQEKAKKAEEIKKEKEVNRV